MTDAGYAPGGARARPWLIDAALGACAALVAVAAAQAALPNAPAFSKAGPVAPIAKAAAAPAVAAEPAAFIAFSAPVPGRQVGSPFGLRQLPWEEARRLHAGVDIAGDSGLPVRAAADGVVTRAGNGGGYGRFVQVRHAAGLTSFYAHLGRIDVAPGTTLKAGESLGALGSSGTSTGPHVHFEIRDAKGRPLNPEAFIGRRFATAEDLPLRAAGRIPGGVRLAHVSNIPTSKRGLMQARVGEPAEPATVAEPGRVRGMLTVADRMTGLRQAAQRDAAARASDDSGVRRVDPWAMPQSDASASEPGPKVIRVEAL